MSQEKNLLSCYVITLNEAQRLPITLASVRGIADDIVVVDSGSTDGTQAIAKAYGARVIPHSFDGFGRQKRFAEAQCRHDWLLNLDADEWLSVDLRREIRHLLSNGALRHAFYRVARVDTIYPMSERPRLWVNCHQRVRLYHRRYGHHSLHRVHEHVEVGRNSVGRLRHRVMHRSVRDFHSLVDKLNSYSSYQAPQGSRRFYGLLWLRLFTEPMTAFVRAYVRDRHITGGLWGFAYSVMEACHHFTRIVKMVEHRKGWDKVPKMPIRAKKLKVPLPVSCCIIAKDEADRIIWPLRALRGVVADIVVVDGGSSDDTVAVARAHGARVVKRAWQGYGVQKRFAEAQCRYDWVLNLDADEWPSAGLLDELQEVMALPEKRRAAAYAISWLRYYHGETRPRPFLRPWYIVRFYDRRRARFNDSMYAEGVVVSKGEKTKKMRHSCYHYPTRSMHHFWSKYNRVTSLVAPIGKPLPILVIRLFTEYVWVFFRSYIIKGGFKDGLRGYIHSQSFAFVYALRIIKKLEYRKVWCPPVPSKP